MCGSFVYACLDGYKGVGTVSRRWRCDGKDEPTVDRADANALCDCQQRFFRCDFFHADSAALASTDPGVYADRNAVSDANTNAHANPDAYAYPDPYSDPDAKSFADAEPDTNAYSHTHARAYP